MENEMNNPPKKSKDGLLALIGFFTFGYFFINTITSTAGIYFGPIGTFTKVLNLGIYAIPFLLSFVVTKKGMKVPLLILGIICLIMGMWQFIYSSFIMGGYYGY